MYKAVLLDVGGVILKIDWAKPFEACGIFDPRRRMELLERFQGSEVFRLYERGKLSDDEFLKGLGEMMEVRHTPDELRAAWRSLILHELPDVNQIFDGLEGVPVHALTNTNDLHLKYMVNEFPVFKRFQKVIASCEIGERKPDVEFYLKACRLCGVDPSEAVFVDDTFENVAAARRAGLHAHQSVNSVRDTLQFLRDCGFKV